MQVFFLTKCSLFCISLQRKVRQKRTPYWGSAFPLPLLSLPLRSWEKYRCHKYCRPGLIYMFILPIHVWVCINRCILKIYNFYILFWNSVCDFLTALHKTFLPKLVYKNNDLFCGYLIIKLPSTKHSSKKHHRTEHPSTKHYSTKHHNMKHPIPSHPSSLRDVIRSEILSDIAAFLNILLHLPLWQPGLIFIHP